MNQTRVMAMIEGLSSLLRQWFVPVALVVLFAVIPYYASVYVTSGNGHVWVHSLLWDYGLQSEGLTINLDLLLVLGIILVCAPGLVFTWRRQVLPKNQSLSESGLVAIGFTGLASLPFMFVEFPTPPGFLVDGFWLGMGIFVALVVLGLILIPMVKWELERVWVYRLKSRKIADLGNAGSSLFSNWGTLLLVLAIAAPNSVMFQGGTSDFILGSVLASVQFSFYSDGSSATYGMMNPALVLPLSFLTNILDFVYVYGVWNYGINRSRYKATVAAGVSGVIFHMFAFPYRITMVHIARLVVAIPVLFVAGQMLLAYCDKQYSRVAPAEEPKLGQSWDEA